MFFLNKFATYFLVIPLTVRHSTILNSKMAKKNKKKKKVITNEINQWLSNIK